MITTKKSKKNILPIILLALFLFEAFTNNPDSDLCNILFVTMMASIIGGEFAERNKNNKKLKLEDKELILATKDSDYYVGLITMTMILVLYVAICTFGRNIEVLKKIIIFNSNYAMFFGCLVLLLGYVSIYLSSTQELYKDGIKLMDNTFISTKDIIGITFRNTIFKKRKLIEITTKNHSIGLSNTVRIKCKNDVDFNKVIEQLKNNTHVAVKAL